MSAIQHSFASGMGFINECNTYLNSYFFQTLNSLTHAQKAQVPSSALAMMNSNRQLEKLQISELRLDKLFPCLITWYL